MRAVLLIPSDTAREALLADGLCGARPPIVWRHIDSPWFIARGDAVQHYADKHHADALAIFAGLGTRPIAALVLAWNGQAIPEGCDRAIRCHGDIDGGHWLFLATPTMEQAKSVADDCAARGLGTVEVLR